MHERRSGGEDTYYYLVLYYQDKILHLRLKQIASSRNLSTWFLYAKNSVQELEWDEKRKKLRHVIIHGQHSFPDDFLSLLENEFIEIHKR